MKKRMQLECPWDDGKCDIDKRLQPQFKTRLIADQRKPLDLELHKVCMHRTGCMYIHGVMRCFSDPHLHSVKDFMPIMVSRADLSIALIEK